MLLVDPFPIIKNFKKTEGTRKMPLQMNSHLQKYSKTELQLFNDRYLCSNFEGNCCTHDVQAFSCKIQGRLNLRTLPITAAKNNHAPPSIHSRVSHSPIRRLMPTLVTSGVCIHSQVKNADLSARARLETTDAVS